MRQPARRTPASPPQGSDWYAVRKTMFATIKHHRWSSCNFLSLGRPIPADHDVTPEQLRLGDEVGRGGARTRPGAVT